MKKTTARISPTKNFVASVREYIFFSVGDFFSRSLVKPTVSFQDNT